MQSNKRSMLIAAALLAALLIAVLGYSDWKSREMERFLAEYLPSTRPGGAGDAVLGAIGVKRYGESTWFERTQAPRWSAAGVHEAAVLSLDNKLSAKLSELGVGAQALGQARVSAASMPQKRPSWPCCRWPIPAPWPARFRPWPAPT